LINRIYELINRAISDSIRGTTPYLSVQSQIAGTVTFVEDKSLTVISSVKCDVKYLGAGLHAFRCHPDRTTDSDCSFTMSTGKVWIEVHLKYKTINAYPILVDQQVIIMDAPKDGE
jgi:hypothetical protein